MHSKAAQILVVFVIVSRTLFLCAADAPPPEHKLDLRPINQSEWKADAGDVKRVLTSTAEELWKYFPERKLPPITIAPKGGPITLFDRGPKGEFQVKLSTGDTYWAQYAFQFAHEFCHVLCDTKPHENPNHWFEESLCETASLFVLRKMSGSWKASSDPNWRSFAPNLKKYADERMSAVHLPEGQRFVTWFRENEQAMRANSTDRPKNRIVASELLPLFEREPAMWEAVSFLNAEKLTKLYSFKQYLEAWRRNSAEKHRAFVDKVAEKFELNLEK